MSRCPVPKSDADVRWFSSNWRGDDLNPAQCSGFGRLCWEGSAVCLTGPFHISFICPSRLGRRDVGRRMLDMSFPPSRVLKTTDKHDCFKKPAHGVHSTFKLHRGRGISCNLPKAAFDFRNKIFLPAFQPDELTPLVEKHFRRHVSFMQTNAAWLDLRL